MGEGGNGRYLYRSSVTTLPLTAHQAIQWGSFGDTDFHPLRGKTMGPSGLEAQSPTDRRRLARALQVLALLVPLSIGGYFGGRLLWASYHLRAAERALAKDKLLDAQEHLRQCLKVRKHDPQVVRL